MNDAFMGEMRKMNENQIINRISVVSFIGNALLAILKITGGVLSRSSAMLSDGLNSIGDIFSSTVAMIGNRIAHKPSDEEHPHGHGKAAYIFSALIGISLLLVAAEAFANALRTFINPEPIDHISFVVFVCFVTIITKLVLFLYTDITGKRIKSPMIMALSEDHRSDIFVTIGTLIGILGTHLGIVWLDPVMGIIIAGIIARAGVKILMDSYRILMDTSESDSSPIMQYARKIILEFPEVERTDSIIARPVGTNFCLEIKIGIDGEMTVNQSHQIANEIKHRLLENDDVCDVLIHINPIVHEDSRAAS